MAIDKISIRNIKNVVSLDIDFKFPDSNIIIITGKNGIGKTTIVKCFSLLVDPGIFAKSSGEDALKSNSYVSFSLSGIQPFSFSYSNKLRALDSKDLLPSENIIFSELPIPYGERFQRFSKVAGVDAELKIKIASSDYERAEKLICFLSRVYSSEKFSNLKSTKINKNTFYFILKDDDYYIREDHFSSGEFFLIQLFRFVTSGAQLILIDELDVALDAAAQAMLYEAMKPLLVEFQSRLVVISHSLAFMNTVDNNGLYYLEVNSGVVSLESRSFAYIKSDLFGFKGYDRYILTEDEVLEGFIEYIIKWFSVCCYFQHKTIGVAGVNQLQKLIEKNDSDQIFSDSDCVMGIVDGDVYSSLIESYAGLTRIVCSPIEDIEKYVYLNRDTLLPDVSLPAIPESGDLKRAAKTYWKRLIKEGDISKNQLYKLIVDREKEGVERLVAEIKVFLEKNN